MNREAIYAALFARASGASWTPPVGQMPSSFQTKSRVLRDWAQIPAEAMPAIFQTQMSQTIVQQRGMPQKVTLRATWYVYVRTNTQADDSVVPAQMMNVVLDGLDAAMAPDATDPMLGNVCTLGGLVSHAWIVGDIETSEGTLGDVEVAIIPVEMLVPT